MYLTYISMLNHTRDSNPDVENVQHHVKHDGMTFKIITAQMIKIC